MLHFNPPHSLGHFHLRPLLAKASFTARLSPEQAWPLSKLVPCAQVDKVAEMCKDILDLSQGKATQRSAGIMEFRVDVDQYEPHVFYFWERYESNASMGRHNTSPEIRAFMENVRCLLWLVVLEALDGHRDLLQGQWQPGPPQLEP